MKIWMIGAPGSGKTTVARALAAELGAPAYELDEIFWQPGWRIAPREELVARVTELAATERWIIDGNYPAAAPILSSAAELLIWIDLPFALTYWRVLSRTARRWARREEIWNGNRESMRNIFQKDGMPVYALLKHRRNQERYQSFWNEFPRTRVRIVSPGRVREQVLQACRELQTGGGARAR